MSRQPKRNRQRPSQADRRAVQWVRKQESAALNIAPSCGVSFNLGAFSVHRLVRSSTPSGIYGRQDITRLQVRHLAAALPLPLAVFLVSPIEGDRLASLCSGDATTFNETLSSKADALPQELKGYLGRAVITGAPRGKPGVRFVGLNLDERLGPAIVAEREQLFAATDPRAAKGYTPLLPLFMTRDSGLANELAVNLNECSPRGIPLELEPAQLVQN